MFNSSFYNFLLNSYYFSKNKLDNLIIDFINKNVDKKQQIDKLKNVIIDIMNNNDYKSVLNEFNYPYDFTDINTIKLDKKIKTFSLEDFINNQTSIELNYFILHFNNTKQSLHKENPLKILKSKIKINGKIYILSSVLYVNNDLLKIQYKNIWDLTDNEYEIRQEYFILNNKRLQTKHVIDKFETHNGDDEYLKEDNYKHRIKYCLYEKYNQKTDNDFIKTKEYPEIDKKYEYIHKIYNSSINNVKNQNITLDYINKHLLQPIIVSDNDNTSTL